MENINGEQPLTSVDAVVELEIDNDDKSINVAEQETTTDGSPIGKFKSVEALYSAYNNLQAEFTKKCQKLSELEKAMPVQTANEKQGNEEISYLSEDWEDKVSAFLGKYPQARGYATRISEEIAKDPSLTLEQSYDRVLASEYKEPKKLIEDEEFLNNYIYNSEKIKDKVLQDYFASLQNNPIPPLMSKGASAVTAEQSERVDNLVEAGKLAINLFR